MERRPRLRDGPVRTCVGCRTARPAAGLVRLVAEDGSLRIGARGSGRGAWLCPDVACFDLAARRQRLARALRCDLTAGAVAAGRSAFVGAVADARGWTPAAAARSTRAPDQQPRSGRDGIGKG